MQRCILTRKKLYKINLALSLSYNMLLTDKKSTPQRHMESKSISARFCVLCIKFDYMSVKTYKIDLSPTQYMCYISE